MSDKIVEFEDIKEYLIEKYIATKTIPHRKEVDDDPKLKSYNAISANFEKETGKTLYQYFLNLGFTPKPRPTRLAISFSTISEILINKSKKLNRIISIKEINDDTELPSVTGINRIFKENGYTSHVEFLKEHGFKLKLQRTRPRNLTYEQLCEIWDRYCIENGVYPTSENCRYDNNLPTWKTVKEVCGDDFIKFYEKYGEGKNVKLKSYEEYCEIFKDICKNEKRTLTTIDLNNKNGYGLPGSWWFVKNCPDESVKDYNDFLGYLGFKPFFNVSKEYARKQIYKKYNKLKRPLKLSDFDNPSGGEISKSIIYNHWGTFNKMLIDLDLPITQVAMMYVRKPIEELKKDIYNLCHHIFRTENRKVISREDVDSCEWCLSSARYDFWFKKELNTTLGEYIKSIGFISNIQGRGMIYIFDDGEITRSQYEFKTSAYLRNNNINYTRDVRYSDFIDQYKGYMDCDYVIHMGDKTWYVEVAGMLISNNIDEILNNKECEKYRKKMKIKIKMLESINANFKIIYLNDFKETSLNDIFSFLN